MSSGRTCLYLHGFASSPGSTKARAFLAWGEAHAATIRTVEALDLRVPSLEHLRFSQIVERVRERITREGPDGRVTLIGSSLGGLAAARVAEMEPRVERLFLMAPAFRIAERWRLRLGEPEWQRWKDTDHLPIMDHATGKASFVDHGFVSELASLDVGFPDVHVPTFVVHGTADDVVDVELSRQWARARPNVELLEVDDGHELTASIPRILEEATRLLTLA